ncbi:D-alanyl-D-alanine carboxypeptidase family protein [Streptomyces crystallinus]|uniref:Peptidase S11 D-alanyl-D-alanine carboxypeptidase A N-terminal domain-containing protein n=1 Tax=Streptomyces crystallinus TaxID=68191 RepID=A0ABP3R0M6_9ACTN
MAGQSPDEGNERKTDVVEEERGAAEAGASRGGASRTDVAEPGAARTDVAQAGAARTDVAQADVAEPDTEHASAAEPGTGQDGAPDRRPEAADAAEPGAAAPGAPGASRGAGPAPASEPESAAEPAPESESESERTSEFVALKPLDPPVVNKPSRPVAAGPASRPASGPASGARDGAAPTPAPDAAPTAPAPLPPLDLLAELTNTPKPPETRARTLTRRFKIWMPVVLLLALVFVVVQAVRPLPAPSLKLGADTSSYTFDGRFSLPWPAKGQGAVQVQGSGSIGTFGEQRPVPTASVAKVMTAYVVLKGHPLKKDEAGPTIEVDEKAVREGQSKDESRIEGLTAGARFSQQDMLKMLMIPSGNNIARLLARWDTGSTDESAFVAKMNEAAKALGMKDTTYTDPSGLDPRTVSTAVDQLRLAEAVMRFDAFRPIVALPNATIKGLPQPINNNNDDLLLAGLSIKGIKTGSNTAAGGALMWAAYKTVGDLTPLVLGTMLDQHVDGPDPSGGNSLKLVKENSKKVVAAVRDALTAAVTVKKGQVVGYVDDGLGGRTPLVATADLKAIGVPGQRLPLRITGAGESVPHSGKAGAVLATLTVGTGSDAPKVPVALQKDLREPSFGAKLTRLG